MKHDTLKDKIRGCLMAGAAGDALGYEVEFMSRRSILSRFGENGITKFALDSNGKALISDDTQMTLFTANGLLNASHLSVQPQFAVARAYVDWYYTQIGAYKTKSKILIVGDSLTSDMKGGNNIGITCCWYNPQNKEKSIDVNIDFEIKHLWDVKEILYG